MGVRYCLAAWATVFLLAGQISALAQSAVQAPNKASGFNFDGPTAPPSRVRITSIVPKSAQAGAIVTIEYFGQSFDSKPSVVVSPANVIVFFNGVPGKILSINNEFVQVAIPEAVQPGKVDVVIAGNLASTEPGSIEIISKAGLSNSDLYLVAVAGAVAGVLALLTTVLLVRLYRLGGREPPSPNVSEATSEAPVQQASSSANEVDDPDDVGIPTPPEGLLQSCSNGTCVLYAGTGLSAQAGLPTWSDALAQFVGKMSTEEGAEKWAGVARQLASGDTTEVLDVLEARGKHEELISLLRGVFSERARFPKEIVRFLESVPLTGVISAALDTTVEDIVTRQHAKVVIARDSLDFTSLLRDSNTFVLKLNEIFSRDQLTFTTDQWSLLLDESPTLRTFLGSLVSTRTILFVGVSLDGIEAFFSALRLRLTPSVQHYALVPKIDIMDTVAERFLSKYRLDLIPISRAGNYRQLPQFLEHVYRTVDVAPDARTRGNQVTLRADRVEKLSLTNIGPFRQAEFDFKSPWTVLLGNNGCGKSTVLRAIALALSGDDDQATAAGSNLLKAGEALGSIRVTVGSIDYETRLVRNQDRINVRCGQVPPLRSGSLLTLGFPAVRGAAVGRVEPKQQASFPYARVEDVMPLVQGGLDSRMNNVRQWIVNNYVRSQDSKIAPSIRTRSRAMIDTFFKVLDDMVPGFKLQFHGCDTKTFEVQLVTSDGILPMGFVSQGMNSTIGWVGVLLQRMFEVYEGDESPEQRHALLLIDEIDSHLHPEWQRLLVSKIVENFPNVQVIASTHSPLVVGNLEAGSVFKFTRDEDVVSVEKLEQSFKGFRADQILTADAFGLESSRGTDWTDSNRRFAALLGKTKRSADEEAEFTKLQQELEKTPRTQESEIGRQAADMVDSMLKERVASLPMSDEQKQLLASEAKSYLEKVSSG